MDTIMERDGGALVVSPAGPYSGAPRPQTMRYAILKCVYDGMANGVLRILLIQTPHDMI